MDIYKVILLISSNLTWLNETLALLEKDKHIGLSAKNGMEGLQVAHCDCPDLIICEDTLSDISAIELCQLIDNDQELPEIPFVLVNETQPDIKEIINSKPLPKNKWLPDYKNLEYHLEFSNKFFAFGSNH